MEGNRVELSRTEGYYTHIPGDAIRILGGSVYVFIVPWSEENGQAGKKLYLCEVGEGRSIPAFAWRDQDFRQWRFMLQANADKVILEIQAGYSTRILQKRFLSAAGISTFDVEGYEGSLISFYRNNELKSDVFIERVEKNAPKEQQKSFGAISSVMGQKTAAGADGADRLYQLMAFACGKAGIPIAGQKKIEMECGEITISSIARASDFICREVVLDVNWHQFDCGVLITTVDGKQTVCYPVGGRYHFYDFEKQTDCLLTKTQIGTMEPKAYSLRRTLPRKALDRKDIVSFVRKSLYRRDVVSLIVWSIVATLIGVLQPKLNQLIYDDYIPMGETSVLLQVCLVIASFMIGNVFISIVKQLESYRLFSRAGYELQDAVYWRMFLLPASFFRKYESADLAERVTGISSMTNSIVSLIVSNGLTACMGVIYLIQMFSYSSKLALAGTGMILLYGLILFFLLRSVIGHYASIREHKGEAKGKLFQYISGIDKIRMAGAEKRAILEYILPVTNEKRETISAGHISSFSAILQEAAPTVFSMVLYYMMIKSEAGVSMGAFIAFNTAFGAFSGSLLGLVSAAGEYLQLKPMIKRCEPIMKTATEDDENKDIIENLKGDISLNHVTFGYTDDNPVLRDLSLHIEAGEYVALVGPSGCGKSTILKLLLGFETPQSGSVCYDGKDLESMNKRSLRKHIGVVLQNGCLISGSIYENITITGEKPNIRDAMAVIEDVGLKEDVEAMPMGIHTLMSESGGTVSGGQLQRILIARSIYNNPSVLYFDEATSALDNLTQAKVCESLEKRKITRMVIAHRLSTVQNCDRILVLDHGQVVEEGNYHTLMEQKGVFYQMAIRQLAE